MESTKQRSNDECKKSPLYEPLVDLLSKCNGSGSIISKHKKDYIIIVCIFFIFEGRNEYGTNESNLEKGKS